MEYLTIQEPRSSHFRGMEHHQSDSYGSRPRDDFSRQARPPTLERDGSPSHFKQSDPGMSDSWRKSSRSINANSSAFYYPHQPSETSTISAPAVTRPAPSSIAALLRPIEQPNP